MTPETRTRLTHALSMLDTHDPDQIPDLNDPILKADLYELCEELDLDPVTFIYLADMDNTHNDN